MIDKPFAQQHTSVMIDRDLHAEIKAYAEETNQTITSVANAAFEFFLRWVRAMRRAKEIEEAEHGE